MTISLILILFTVKAIVFYKSQKGSKFIKKEWKTDSPFWWEDKR